MRCCDEDRRYTEPGLYGVDREDQVAGRQLSKAGYRLAALLNQVWPTHYGFIINGVQTAHDACKVTKISGGLWLSAVMEATKRQMRTLLRRVPRDYDPF